ncbi:MAG: hypothetical protein R2750_08105 [Bacteroidales bacterium]
MEREILSTNRKALRLNLNPNYYGTIAEIGGREVARNFFQAGVHRVQLPKLFRLMINCLAIVFTTMINLGAMFQKNGF